jgi:hypothetical protein
MSKLYSASQYDGAYKASKLGNWEVPDKSKVREKEATTTPHILAWPDFDSG